MENWCWWRCFVCFCYSSNILGCTQCFSLRGLVYGWECPFLSFFFFSQDNGHMELTVFIFFQNPYAILQHYHDFHSNVAIFPSVVQAYTQPYLLSARIKQIICQTNELSVTFIHTYIHNWSFQLFSQYHWLSFSHPICCVCYFYT